MIIYDDFKGDTANVYRETLHFLGVNEAFQPEFKVINPNRYPRFLVVTHFVRDPFIRRLGKALLPEMVRKGVKGIIWRLNIKYMPRPAIDPELRLRLQAEFTPEIESLSALLRRDLTHWCKT